MTLLKDKLKKSFEALKGKIRITNVMQSPKIDKIIISVGVGKFRQDKKKIEIIENRLLRITGQKPIPCVAKKSIAAFKLREGDIVGYKVTLRGKRMRSFFDRFLNIALPRTRDFRGINRNSVDPMGNLTIGIRESTIFPELSDEDITNIFGLAVSLISNMPDRQKSFDFFEYLGIPFKKQS